MSILIVFNEILALYVPPSETRKFRNFEPKKEGRSTTDLDFQQLLPSLKIRPFLWRLAANLHLARDGSAGTGVSLPIKSSLEINWDERPCAYPRDELHGTF